MLTMGNPRLLRVVFKVFKSHGLLLIFNVQHLQILVWTCCARTTDLRDLSIALSDQWIPCDCATMVRSRSVTYGSVGSTVAPSAEYRCMKCNTNNIMLILTLTLKLTLILYLTPNPILPYQ